MEVYRATQVIHHRRILLLTVARTLNQGWQSQEYHSQKKYTHGNVEEKNVSRIHNLAFLTIKTLDIQKRAVAITPHTIIGNFVLSRPGATNGKTIEAADSWPAATPISARTLSWESVNNGKSIDTNNIITKFFLSTI